MKVRVFLNEARFVKKGTLVFRLLWFNLAGSSAPHSHSPQVGWGRESEMQKCKNSGFEMRTVHYVK